MSDTERPKASHRPMTIDLDLAGEQFLATAESEHACIAVYASNETTDAELQALLGDVRHDLPEQGRRIGVIEQRCGGDVSDDERTPTQEDSP